LRTTNLPTFLHTHHHSQVSDLRKILRRRGLKADGKKPALLARVLQTKPMDRHLTTSADPCGPARMPVVGAGAKPAPLVIPTTPVLNFMQDDPAPLAMPAHCDEFNQNPSFVRPACARCSAALTTHDLVVREQLLCLRATWVPAWRGST